jgi:biopolymer transport protein ExbD
MFRMPRPARMDLNLAPMVDVMMCLIIFFLLASKLVTAERFAVDLPWAAAAREVADPDLGRRVAISVRPGAGGDATAEYVIADWDGRQIVERVLAPEDLAPLLRGRAERVRAENPELALRCLIRADENVQYQHVEQVLRAAGLARLRHIVFAANQGAGPPLTPPRGANGPPSGSGP